MTVVDITIDHLAIATRHAAEPDEWPVAPRFNPSRRIVNRAHRPAISIHVYGPALTTMTRYRVGADGLHVVDVDRAGEQW